MTIYKITWKHNGRGGIIYQPARSITEALKRARVFGVVCIEEK